MEARAQRDVLTRRLATGAAIGAIVWIALFALTIAPASGHELIERLFLFAVLVIVPLGLRLSARPDADGTHPFWFRAAARLHPLAAGAAVVALALHPGTQSALCAAAWFAFTITVAAWGAARALRRRTFELGEACVDVGLVYIVVGGSWLVASRALVRPMGFPDEIVAMTAVHFHYAGFAAPIIAGVAGRRLPPTGSARGMWRIGALGVAAGPILVAIGITVSPLVEVVSAFALAITLTLLALVVALRVAPRVGALPAVLLWTCSASLFATMTLACGYALGEFLEAGWIPVATMAHTHGLANAFGFALPGLLAFTLAGRAEPGVATPPIGSRR